jgi:hypothetical protein
LVARIDPAVTLPAEILVAKIDPAVAPVTINEEILELVTLLFVIVLLAALKLPTEIFAAEIPVEAKSEATVAPDAFTLVALALVITQFVTVPREAKTDPAVTLPAEILVARIDPAVAPVTLNEEILELVTLLFVIVLLAALKLPAEIFAAEIPVEAKSEATVTPEAFTLVALALVITQFVTVPREAKTDPAVTLPAEILVARIEPAVASVTLNEEILLLRDVPLAMLLLTAKKLPTEIFAAEIPVEAKSEATVAPEAFTLVTVWFVPTASVKRSVLAVKLVISIFVAVIFVASKFVRVSFVPIASVKRSVLVVKLVLRMFVAVKLFVAILGELTEVVTFKLPVSEILIVVRVSV